MRKLPWHSFRGLREWYRRRKIDHAKRGADALGGAVLEADHGIDGYFAFPRIDRLDDASVFLVDHTTANLSRARQFAVIGVELLVQQKEAGDALRWRQRGIDGLYLPLQQRIDFR